MFALYLAVVAVAAVFAVLSHRAGLRARRAERAADGTFLMAFSGLLAKVALADGQVTPDESETVERMFSDMGLPRAERALCVGNFLLAQREPLDATACAQALAKSLNRISCRLLYGLLWRVALADWRVSEEEERMLFAVGRELGIDESEFGRYRAGETDWNLDRRALEDAGVPSSLLRLCNQQNRGLGMWDR